MSTTAVPTQGWPKRYTVIGLCFLATFLCYIDRVNISIAIIPMAQDLGWDREIQGRVLSAFFVGYLLTQILGGRLADRFGGKIVLAGGVLIWSAFTALTPPAAFLGVWVLLITRVLMGTGEAVTFPSIYSLIARWIPTTERGRAVALNFSGIPLGTVLALLICPWIAATLGWPWIFYIFGALGLFWFAAWQWLGHASPEEDPSISSSELEMIRREAPNANAEEQTPRPPWKALLSSGPVWAIIVGHFCMNWGTYVLLSWLPTYVNEALEVDFEKVGAYSMLPHLTSFVFLNLAGYVADRLVRTGMDVTFVRKLMMTIAFVGLGTALAVVGYIGSAGMAIAIMSLGTALGAFAMGGFGVNHMDIAPRHSGLLMGISNTAATIPGIVGVYATGVILDFTGSWTLVFQVASGIYLAGLIFYLIFATGERVFD